jgi:hypothetical protein
MCHSAESLAFAGECGESISNSRFARVFWKELRKKIGVFG